jgi:ABC-type nitrate/sulfonate/bicarbonate transport system permease component
MRKQTAAPGVSLLRDLSWHLWLPVALVAAWLLVSSQLHSTYFPPLTAILAETWDVWVGANGLLVNLWPSFLRLMVGFILAMVAGVFLGTLFGLMPRLETAFRPLTEAFRAVPGAALLPIALMFFGTGEGMKIFLIAFASMWPIMLNTIEGVRSIHPTLGLMVRTFRVKPLDRFTHVYLPAAAPQVFAGSRIALGIGVAVMVVVEMFGTPGGVGYYIRHSQANFQVLEMWTGMVVLGIFGYALNALFRTAEKRILNWHHSMVAHTQGASA